MRSAWLFAVVLAAAGCAPSAQRTSAADRGHAGAGRLECMSKTTISGFQALDDRHVILYGIDERDAYVAEVAPGCFGISSTTSIGTVDVDGNGQICAYGRDELAYREAGRTESCRILSLQRRKPGT